MIIRFKLFESTNIDNVKIYYCGNINKEIFISLVDNDKVVGGLYCGKPPTGENHLAVMKVGILKELKGKGYGSLLYLAALSLSKNGISPHRRKGSSEQDSQDVWLRLNEKSYIQRIDLKTKLYDDKPFLDSKYILTDENMKKNILNRTKKLSNDAFDKSIEINKNAWDIVNKLMDDIFYEKKNKNDNKI